MTSSQVSSSLLRSILRGKEDVRDLEGRQTSVDDLINREDLQTIVLLHNACTPEQKEIIGNESQWPTYRGGSDYTYADPEVEDIMKPLQDMVVLSYGSYTFTYYLGELKKIQSTSWDQYVRDKIEELNSSVASSLNYTRRSLQGDLETLQWMKGFVDNIENGDTESAIRKYKPDDFSFYYPSEREMIQDHWQAVQDLNLQEFFAKPVDESTGYMFSDAPELRQFGSHPLVDQKYGHSGASFGFVCRRMQNICQKGWQEFVRIYINTYVDTIKEAYDIGLLPVQCIKQ